MRKDWDLIVITYVNNSEASNKYTVLFSKATQALVQAEIDAHTNGEIIDGGYAVDTEGNPQRGDDGLYISNDPIRTIEKYFYYLPKLVELGGANSSDPYTVLHSEGRRYTMLPMPVSSAEEARGVIGERLFEINTNTRAIDIPVDFARNGVSVQGDELAEILYFSIDRFYDAMDLDTADIYIQWTKQNGDSGVSIPWVVDIESTPNKIIFGWALSSTITELAGPLKFAVRFYQWADDAHTKLAYSLSTLTHTIQIKQALDFTLGSNDYLSEIGIDDVIVSRIKNSKTNVTDNEDAAMPVYVFNMKELAELLEHTGYAHYDEETKTAYIDLMDENDGVEGLTQDLMVQAKSVDSGTISYTWSFIDIENNADIPGNAGEDSDKSHSTKSIVFIPTKDTEVKDKVYYQKVENGGVIAYEPFDVAGLEAGKTPALAGLFEKFSVLTVNKVGTYYATASNRKAQTNASSLESDRVVVPMPSMPYLVEEDGVKSDLNSGYILETNPEKDRTVTLAVTADNAETNGTHVGVLTYEWFMKNDLNDDFVPVEGAPNANSLTLTFDADKADKEVEGYYKVRITNSKNSESVFIESGEGRLSYPATSPDLSYPTEGDTRVDFSNKPLLRDKIKVVIDADWKAKWNVSDKLTYQWFVTTDEMIGNDNDIPVEGATESFFEPTEQGKYYCVVTNHKNGTTATEASPIFYVV